MCGWMSEPVEECSRKTTVRVRFAGHRKRLAHRNQSHACVLPHQHQHYTIMMCVRVCARCCNPDAATPLTARSVRAA